MNSSKKAWDDVGESVGGLSKSLSKRFQNKTEADPPVTDGQLKSDAKEAGKSFLGALSATADEVSGKLSAALDGGNDDTGPAMPPPSMPPPAMPTPSAPAEPVDLSTLPPPPATETTAPDAVDPSTLPPPSVGG